MWTRETKGCGEARDANGAEGRLGQHDAEPRYPEAWTPGRRELRECVQGINGT